MLRLALRPAFMLFTVALQPLLSFGQTSFEEETFTRGMMIAVDSRYESECHSKKEYLRALRVELDEDLCLDDSQNPLRVVVLMAPSSEWEFLTELDLSRSAKKSMKDQNVGFTRASSGGLLYILPSKRHSDNLVRMGFESERITAAQVRLSDLSMLTESGRISLTLSFIHKNVLASHRRDQDKHSDSLLRHVRIKSNSQKSVEEEGAAALSSLNILNEINSSLQNAADNDSIELGFFIPDLNCPHAKYTCDSNPQEGGNRPIKRFGFTFKIAF